MAPDGGFQILFPNGPPSTQSKPGRTDYWRYDGSTTYRVQVFTKNDYSVAKSSAILRDYPNPASSGVDGKVVDARPLKMGRYTGRAVRIEGTPQQRSGRVVLLSRAYVTDGHLNVIGAASAPGQPISPKADRFLESFAILK